MRTSKIAALLLAVLMLVPVIAGCGEEPVSAITFRDTSISENEYCYMMSYYKGLYLYNYFGKTSDDPTIWTSELADGVTIGDYLGALTVSNIMSAAVYIDLFDEYGLTLTNEEINSVDQYIDGLISKLGSKSALNSALSAFGANIDAMRKVKIDSLKVTELQEHLYGENGIYAATEEEIDAYYNENYYRTKFIFISKTLEYERGENGEYKKNDEGDIVTREMTAEEKTAKEALFKDIEARIASGEDFETLLKEYTMDTGMLHFDDGYYINSASTFVESKVKTAVAELEINKTVSLETDAGWYIIKRYELIDGAYDKEEYASAMFGGDLGETVNTVKMQKLLSEYSEEIIVNDQTVADYPLAYCTPNFNY